VSSRQQAKGRQRRQLSKCIGQRAVPSQNYVLWPRGEVGEEPLVHQPNHFADTVGNGNDEGSSLATPLAAQMLTGDVIRPRKRRSGFRSCSPPRMVAVVASPEQFYTTL
jgi:hypothetical protein